MENQNIVIRHAGPKNAERLTEIERICLPAAEAATVDRSMAMQSVSDEIIIRLRSGCVSA